MTIQRSVAVGLAAIGIGSAVAMLVMVPLTASVPSTVFGFRGAAAILGGLYGSGLGLAIAFRQPRNAIAWIFLVAGACAGVYDLASAYGEYALLVRGGAIAGGEWAAWIASWVWIPYGAVMPMFLPLLFPDGRPPSPRWGPVVWFAVLMIAAFATAAALAPGPLNEAPLVRNPVSPFPEGAFSFADVQALTLPPLLAALFAGVAALVQRFRRSRGVERLQLKWFVYASALAAGAMVFIPVVQTQKILQIFLILAQSAVPVAAGIAIFRYRLYDIDLLINRTLVYGVTSTALAVVFFVGILALQPLLRPLTGGSQLAIAVSTLLSFALFQPIRRRAQDVVDRRFYRARYDAARTIDAFSVRLRGDVDLDSVRTDLITVIDETIHPTHASVWLRRSGQ